MKKILNYFMETVHQIIFRQDMSVNMKKFLFNFSWSIMGMGTFSIIMLFINIFAGRLIGPEGYGKYNLIVSITQILLIPIIFGMDSASIRSIANSKTSEEKSKNISNTLYFVIMTTCVLLLLITFFYVSFLKWLNNDTKLFLLLLLLFTILLAFKTILDGFIRGLNLFKFQFLIRLTEIFTASVFFVFFFFIIKKMTYPYYLTSLLSSTLIVTILYIKKLKPFFKRPDFETLKKLFSYGKILTMGTISGIIFGSLDKLIVAKYLSISQLGIYSAYYTAASFVSINIAQLFINVFFPTIIGTKNKFLITKKINKLIHIFFIPGIFLSSLVVFVAIKLFGAQYKIDTYYIASFSILGILQIAFSTYQSLIIAISKKLFKKYLLRINIFSLLYVGICTVTILSKLLTIQTMINILIIYVFGMIIIQKRLLNDANSYSE